MFGERDQIEELIERIQDSYEQSHFEEARELSREACAKARQLFEETNLSDDESLLAMCLVCLGRACVAIGDVAEAEAPLKEAVALRRHQVVGGGEELSEALGELGLVYADLGQLDLAEEILCEALTIDREDYGADPSRLAWSQVYYGSVQVQFDRWPEAEKLFRDAVEMLDSTPDTQAEVVSHLLENFVRYLGHWFDQNEYQKALPMALLGAELARDYPQADDRLRVSVMLGLGETYLGLEQFEPAEHAASEALEMARDLLEETDELLANAWSLLGEMHLELDKLDAAEGEIEHAIRIYQGKRESHKTDLVECTLDLVEIAFQREAFEKIEPLYRRALSYLDRGEEEYLRVLRDALESLFEEATERLDDGEEDTALTLGRIAKRLATEHLNIDPNLIADCQSKYPDTFRALDKLGGF